jgi:hypothetical protein
MTLSVSIMSDEIRSQVAAAIVWNGATTLSFTEAYHTNCASSSYHEPWFN